MCGIVCFFGQTEGLTRVLEALHLLEYRAPDSSGLVAINEQGELAVRRSVGPPRKLVAAMAGNPLHERAISDRQRVADMLAKQGLGLDPDDLHDCSPAAGHTLHDLYHANGLRVGIGDRGSPHATEPADPERRFSSRMRQTLRDTSALRSPDYDQDPVHHAFRLVATHVASRAALDEAWRDTLDRSLLARVPANAYTRWQEAWEEEVATNTPGQAFAVAVRHFQQTFPGLAEHLNADGWERVGGLTAKAMAHIVVGHGRWAMVGAVTEANAHPLIDRSQTRAVVENGSHNAPLMLGIRDEQERWWRARGIPDDEPVHRSENTTEVVAYEWERAYHELLEGELSEAEQGLHGGFLKWGINDAEEQALRIALKRMTAGNAHACAFYSRHNPGVLYVSSHHKPIAIAIRTTTTERPPRFSHRQPDSQPHDIAGTLTGPDTRPNPRRSEPSKGSQRRELMVASDVNAALMLWPGADVDAAAERIQALQNAAGMGDVDATRARQEIEALLDRFTVDVIFLDTELYRGEELFARISNRVEAGRIVPEVQVTRYDGTPVAVTPQRVRLNPAMVGRRGYATYTESHIAEIPDVLDELAHVYVDDGQVRLERLWQDSGLIAPGLNTRHLQERYGDELQELDRLLLVGEGSSWRDAQAAAPLFRELLPGVVINIYRPVEVLNLGTTVDPTGDLAIEISWSGTTDSLLKVDNLLSEMNVLRVSITGRPQSDLGRRTAGSGGTVNVRTGVEVSVATVKGYEAILATLDMLAVHLANTRGSMVDAGRLARLTNELSLVIPRHVRRVLEDEAQRERIRSIAQRCRNFNKVAVVGGSPIDLEGELKIEELAQIVAGAFDFHASSLRPLIERSALVDDDRKRTLFIVNATTPSLRREARAIIKYLKTFEVFCIIHTTPHEEVADWQRIPTAEVLVSPQVSERLQPLIDALFFFDLAVAMAYARGLSPEDIDRPRNLAKSVTTTGAERRSDVEAREEFRNVTLAEFGSDQWTTAGQDQSWARSTRATLRATAALRAATAVIAEPLPRLLEFDHDKHLIVVTDTETTENAATMAAAAWERLLGMDVRVYRRFMSEVPAVRKDTALLRLTRAGAVLTVPEAQTVALPTEMSPLELELLTTIYLISLAVRLARRRGKDTTTWEAGLARLPLVIEEVLGDPDLAGQVRGALSPYVTAGYDKAQIIGGGQDHVSAASIARSLRMHGFMAEALYADSAWHGPLATVGGPDADHDTLIVILATDPLFQPAALVDTQVYRTRHAPVLLVVPEGNQDLPAVHGVDPSAVLTVPAVPRPFVPVVNVALGAVLAREMSRLWEDVLARHTPVPSEVEGLER